MLRAPIFVKVLDNQKYLEKILKSMGDAANIRIQSLFFFLKFLAVAADKKKSKFVFQGNKKKMKTHLFVQEAYREFINYPLKTLLIVGNKRSGQSFFNLVLNPFWDEPKLRQFQKKTIIFFFF